MKDIEAKVRNSLKHTVCIKNNSKIKEGYYGY